MRFTLIILFITTFMIGCMSEQQKKENSQAFWLMMEESKQAKADVEVKFVEGGLESLFKRRFGNEESITLRDVIKFIEYHFEDEINDAVRQSYLSHFKLSEQRNRRMTDDLIQIMLDGAKKSVDKTVYEIAKDLVKKGGFL